jgi:threonine/homoserine/homoserine lactone efflux protein
MRILGRMPSPNTLLGFGVATLMMLIVPGPSVAYVVARSLEHGRTGGLVSVLGIETGALVHVAAAACGLTAVLASSPWAFRVLQYAGATYLVILGIRQLRRRPLELTVDTVDPSVSRWKLFRSGVLVDLLNPKTGLFFLAFLPQFVDPARGALPAQILVLGGCFVLLAALTDGAYALAAGSLRSALTRSARTRRRLDRTTGGVYVGLGGLAALV